MVRGLFISVPTQRLGSQSLLDLHIKDLVWVIYYLDMHVSSLLGFSALLSTPGPELATVHAINTAAHNIAHYKRSDHVFLASASIAMGIELMKLMGRITSVATVINPRYELPSPSSDMPEWNDLRTELETWEFMLKSIFADGDGNLTLFMLVLISDDSKHGANPVDRARHHLECHLFLAQIALYHAFLRQHCESRPTKRPSDVDDINKGQTCTAAATNAITYISMYLEQTQATSLPFHSAYVLFVSLLTLTVASVLADDHGRHGFQHIIYVATRTLTNSNFGSDRTKTHYLEFIQACSNQDHRVSSSSTNHYPTDLNQWP